MTRRLAFLWLGVLCALVHAQISRKNLVLCRQIADKVKDATKPFLQDNSCALDVLLVASPGGPGQDVKFYFQVNRTKPDSFEPTLQYEVPSNNKTQLAAFDLGYVGVVPSNFDPTKISTLETITFVNSSMLYRKNFSDIGVETLLDPKNSVSIKQAGAYKAVGWFRVVDKANVLHEYVAVRDNVDVKELTVHTFPKIAYDETTTYCWRVQNQTGKDNLVYDEESFDSNCPISMNITNPLVATNQVPFDIAWTMKLIPNYLGNGGKGVYDLGNADTPFPILHSSVHICTIEDEGRCHMFNPKNYTLSSADQTGSSLAVDPAAPPTSFAASELSLIKGQYIGFVHGVVKKVDGSFLHVATYFQLKVDEKLAASSPVNPLVGQVAAKTYCWLAYAPASLRNVSVASAVGGYSIADSCPLFLSLNAVGQATTNSQVELRVVATQPVAMPNLVTVASLPEGFNISLATISYCKNATECGPFKNHPTTIDLQPNGRLEYKPLSLTFREPGTYTVYFTTTVDVGKGLRLDSSVVASINVQDSLPPTSNTTLYIAIIGGVVGLLLIVGIIWCCIKRRRKARWDQERLHRGAMNNKDPNNRVHSSIPMVNQRGGITEVPRLLFDSNEGQNQKLDLAVSHYMYNQDARRVDEMPPRRVTSQYDPRSSMGYDTHQEEMQLGYEDYYRHQQQPQRTKSRGGYDEYERRRARSRGQEENFDIYGGGQHYQQPKHQLVIRDEYQRNNRSNSKHLALAAHAQEDDYAMDTSHTSNLVSPSSVRNNYGGYSANYDEPSHKYMR